MSLFGLEPNVNQVSHFADITLEQNSVKLQDNQVVVNDRFRPTLIPQLETSTLFPIAIPFDNN